MSATSLTLSAAERAELVRDPEVFVKRAELVLTNVLQKLNRLEAERSAERIDAEQQFHDLERGHAILRKEHDEALAKHGQMASDRAAIVKARDEAAADAARLAAELKEKSAECARAREAEREGGEERRRLLETNERKVCLLSRPPRHPHACVRLEALTCSFASRLSHAPLLPAAMLAGAAVGGCGERLECCARLPRPI